MRSVRLRILLQEKFSTLLRIFLQIKLIDKKILGIRVSKNNLAVCSLQVLKVSLYLALSRLLNFVLKC